MYRLLLFISFFALGLNTTFAQPTDGLVGYYSFDDCNATDDSGNGSDGVVFGNILCDCGVSGTALKLDGIDDYIIFLGLINNYFNTADFTVSFYFKSNNFFSIQNILGKQEFCDDEKGFELQFVPNQDILLATLTENTSKTNNMTVQMESFCWKHIVFIREGNRSFLYVNGILVETKTSNTRVDISNDAVFSLSNSPCLNNGGVFRYKGLFDELRVYNRALDEDEIETLYFFPDRPTNKDTLIYLGNVVDIKSGPSCEDDIAWTPTDGVSNPDILTPVMMPDVTTTYKLTIKDNDGCVTEDTFRIRVIDPNDLDCQQIFLPKAFTPNQDNLNEEFGISNPFAVEDLVSFDIFDRWGSNVYSSNNPFKLWDGNYNGEPVPSGVYVYKLSFNCKSENQEQYGSVTVIR